MCNNIFGSKSNLEEHKRTHTGEKKLSNVISAVRLLTKQKMMDHAFMEHQNENIIEHD